MCRTKISFNKEISQPIMGIFISKVKRKWVGES